MFIFRDSEKPFETSEENGKFSIPLRALLRKLLGRDASKPEIAAENVFPQLARLRGLRDDILALDAYLVSFPIFLFFNPKQNLFVSSY